MSENALIPYANNEIETLEEALSRQFCAWEKRGRGWEVYDFPVDIEPRPRPFYFAPPPEPPAIDDAQVQTFFSKLFGSGGASQSLARAEYNEDLEQYKLSFTHDDEPDVADYYHESFIEVRLLLPGDLRPAKLVIEQFLSTLDYTAHPIGFEVIGTSEQVVIQFCATRTDLRQVKQQFAAHLPEASLIEGEDVLTNTWINGDYASCIVDFGLSEEFFLPLGTVSNLEADPLIAIVGAMAELDEDEVGVFQVLFKKARYDWSDAIVDAVTRLETTEFLSYLPDVRSQTKEKLRTPFYAAIVRVAAKSDDERSAMRIVKNISGGLSQLSRSGGNALIPLSNDGYDYDQHETALLDRLSFRGGMLLNREELVSLAHPPASTVKTEKLTRVSTRTRAAPANVRGNSLRLGINEHQGEAADVSVSNDQRTRHMHLIGSSGSGKSTLLLNMIKQDLVNGEGVCVLDPHGDLIDDVVSHIPQSRINDVILFDPSDAEFPVGFNILEGKSELENTLLASDLIATFRRMSTSWGDVMDSVLANAILAFVENPRGGTLFDLKRFLVEPAFREEVLQTVRDPSVKYFWMAEFPLISGKPQSSILIRLDAFLRQKLVRNVVCQKEMKFSFREVMDKKKILLLKLSQGLIGEENAYMLGTLLVSKLYQTALMRQDSSIRPHFWLYIDEFHHFITPSMERILAGTRKYNLGLVLAHQEFRQMQSRSQEVASSVLSNCYTRVCFRMGDGDAEKFAAGFSFFDAKALQNLGVGEAIARVERAEYDFNLKTAVVRAPLEQAEDAIREQVKQASRDSFARSRKEVEAELVFPEPPPPAVKKQKEPAVTAERPKPSTTPPEVTKTVATVPPLVPREPAPIPKPIERQPAAIEDDVEIRQHKHLQALIRRIGEDKGFRATIEKSLGDKGRVDVSLANDELKIACEISVTNEVPYEIRNIRKCLECGYDHVVMISANEKHLAKIRKAATEEILEAEQAKIQFFRPDEFYSWLEQIATQIISTDTVKGMKVKMTVRPIDEAKQSSKKKSIANILFGAIRRMKEAKKPDEENDA